MYTKALVLVHKCMALYSISHIELSFMHLLYEKAFFQCVRTVETRKTLCKENILTNLCSHLIFGLVSAVVFLGFLSLSSW